MTFLSECPMRRIVHMGFIQGKYAPPLSGTAEIKLSCGHTVYREWSKAPLKNARCWECGRHD
jgi:hypothetical protein